MKKFFTDFFTSFLFVFLEFIQICENFFFLQWVDSVHSRQLSALLFDLKVSSKK